MFRPPIVAIFMEVFMKDMLPRTSKDSIFDVLGNKGEITFI